jgi:hypothetical protein
MRYDDIPQLPRANYGIDISWQYLEEHIMHNQQEVLAPRDLTPDFQRAHVWTAEQQRQYVEYNLMGGEVSRVLTFNCPGWQGSWKGPYVIIDGKQRLEAVRAFLRNDLRVFGRYRKDFTGRLGISGPSFRCNVCTLETRAEALRLYLSINAGGTPHTSSELSKVRRLLEKELPNDTV